MECNIKWGGSVNTKGIFVPEGIESGREWVEKFGSTVR